MKRVVPVLVILMILAVPVIWAGTAGVRAADTITIKAMERGSGKPNPAHRLASTTTEATRRNTTEVSTTGGHPLRYCLNGRNPDLWRLRKGP